ncbi:MAG TPA: thioredoxin family protein [Chloroflexota bacterium]|jgi:hypothetical protein|nr:thioredoxin family protein [Chloroflexota bacterium]
MPVMPKERFQAATTFDEYVDRMKVNKEPMQTFTDEVQISPEDVQWWRNQGKLNVYVLTYDGCGDALYNIPVMAKIAKQCPNVDLRVVQRDENLDVMDQYKNQSLYRSVPTFIVMDEKMEEIGNLKERAESISQVIEAEMLKVRRGLREQNKEAWRQEMARELRTVVAERKRYA